MYQRLALAFLVQVYSKLVRIQVQRFHQQTLCKNCFEVFFVSFLISVFPLRYVSLDAMNMNKIFFFLTFQL